MTSLHFLAELYHPSEATDCLKMMEPPIRYNFHSHLWKVCEEFDLLFASGTTIVEQKGTKR